MEHMFREELHAMFTAHSTDKRSRRFRRSGSLDGNARGEKRIIFSEEEQPAMVPLEQLYVYCCVLLCTVVYCMCTVVYCCVPWCAISTLTNQEKLGSFWGTFDC